MTEVQPSRPAPAARPRWRSWLAVTAWTLTAIYFVVAGSILAVRHWVLPDIDRFAPRIEQAVSAAIGKRVTIGQVHARWLGLHPEIELSDLRIHDAEGHVALSIPAVEAVIGWRSLPLMSLRLHSLAIDQPDLDIRRDSSGRLFVAGMGVGDEKGGSGLSRWLLSQPELVVRDARIRWDDQARAAPALNLLGVTFVLRNSGDVHRFGLKAQTARELASALDIRGELRGTRVRDLEGWSGRLYAELDYVDLGAWQQWLDYPFEIFSGKGGLRMWLAFDGKRITEAIADVALAQLRTRLAHNLPILELDYLQGRLGGADTGSSINAQAQKVTLKTTAGVVLAPTDFTLHWQRSQPKHRGRGELRASSLQVEPMVTLADYLPVPAPVRQRLLEHQPRGELKDVRFSWMGELDRLERFSLRGRFSGLGMKSHQSWPGFAGLSGTVEATEAKGALHIDPGTAVVSLPGVLREEQTAWDSLTAQASWTRSQGELQLKIARLALANRDVAGSVQGTYSTRSKHSDSAGTIDLAANIDRMDAKSVYRYIPFLPKPVYGYLKDSLAGGQLSEGRLRLTGELEDFPFPEGRNGLFRITAHLANGEYAYADDWPKLSSVSAEITLDGTQLQVFSPRAALFGARLSSVRAYVPDLYHGNERLRVEGQADAPMAEFLRFIRSSPVDAQIGGFTRNFVATGSGRLQLTLNIPLSDPSKTRVVGTLDLNNNTVTLSPDLPPFTQANGRLEFTEREFSGKNLAAQFIGGPATFSVITRGEGAYSVSAQGTANIAVLRKHFDAPLLDRASGSASWKGTVNAAPGHFDVLVESPLSGVTIALPAPFAKPAGETLPLRFERTTRADTDFVRRFQIQRLPRDGDALFVSLGRLATAVMVRRRSGENYVLERGALGVNEPPPALAAGGLSVAGRFSQLDIDRWRPFMERGSGQGGGEGIVRSVNVSIGALDVAGKRLNDVKLRAAPGSGGWSAEVGARELAGTVNWRPEGRGRLSARLKHLMVPEASPAPLSQEAQSSELPALDVVADQFILGDTRLGRLELMAVNQARDWRIEKLSLVTGDSTFLADGAWQSWATRPSVHLNVKLNVQDAGTFFARMGYPGTVRGGTAKMDGKVGWVGSPQAIDYPTLSGQLGLSASKGQFLKADPGISKLLGILSLQSWITFDFRDVFGEGFNFETLSATANIAKGVMTTEDFSMNGKAAQVSMRGAVDLARETQSLKVRMVPSVGDSVSSVAGLLLANPVAGLGALVAQRILKDPLGRIFAFEYSVTGTWSEPKVERIGAEAPIENPGQ